MEVSAGPAFHPACRFAVRRKSGKSVLELDAHFQTP